MNDALCERIEQVTGAPVARLGQVSASWGLAVIKAELANGAAVAVKTGTPDLEGHLETEAFMLRELARLSELPVPQVFHADASLLVMSWIDNDGGPSGPAQQRHAAELIAALHASARDRFGYARDTVIGGLWQPNPQGDCWVDFFRDHRLMHFSRLANERGHMPAALLARLEVLAGRLERYLAEPPHPALLHGDLWGGNVLVRGTRIAGFIDPAIYIGHPEIELAFATLFGTFGENFFEAYRTLAPFEADFFEIRRDLYNIYPNLVHAILFGPSYLAPVARTLDRLGL